jgi:hypothetical protein
MPDDGHNFPAGRPDEDLPHPRPIHRIDSPGFALGPAAPRKPPNL